MGYVSKDVELKKTPKETSYCKNTVAYETGWGDNLKQNFLSFTIWGKQAEFFCNYFNKGDGVHLDGVIEDNNYKNKEGNTVYSKDFRIDKVTFPSVPKKQREKAAGTSESENRNHSVKTDEIPF